MLRRPSGPTATAIAVATFRAVYECAPATLAVFDDPFASRLVPKPLGRLACLAQSRPRLGWALHRILARFSFELSTNLALRTAAIDDAIRQALEGGVTQFVILGSGLDARAWRMPEIAGCSMFELDRPGAHAVKRDKLAGYAARPRRHRLVSIDFENETLADVLEPAGFDTSEPTLWLWEAVALYLTPGAIEQTLSAVAGLCPTGSTLIATYTPPNLGQGERWTMHWRLAAKMVGEPLQGEMATESLHVMLAGLGFEVVSDDTATQWAERYWPPSERHHARGWERLVVARATEAPQGG